MENQLFLRQLQGHPSRPMIWLQVKIHFKWIAKARNPWPRVEPRQPRSKRRTRRKEGNHGGLPQQVHVLTRVCRVERWGNPPGRAHLVWRESFYLMVNPSCSRKVFEYLFFVLPRETWGRHENATRELWGRHVPLPRPLPSSRGEGSLYGRFQNEAMRNCCPFL
jgi:hypothetical protein